MRRRKREIEEVLPANKQKIALTFAVKLIAREQAKSYISKLPSWEYCEDLEDELTKTNLIYFNNLINDIKFVCLPFILEFSNTVVDNPLMFLLNTQDEFGNFIELEGISIQDKLLSLTIEQRENCYLIKDGKIQDFSVDNNNVILAEIESEVVSKPIKRGVSKKDSLIGVVFFKHHTY